jgi:hypothetical protein
MPRIRHAYLEQERPRRRETHYYRTLIVVEPGGTFSAQAEWGKFQRRPSRRRTAYRGPDRSAAITVIDEIVNAKRREGWRDTRDPQRSEDQPQHPRLALLIDRTIALPKRRRARMRIFAPIGGDGLGAIVLESAALEALEPYHEVHKTLLHAVGRALWPEPPDGAPYALYLRGAHRGAHETFYRITVTWPRYPTSPWISSMLTRATRALLEVSTGPLGPAPRRPRRRVAA